MFQDLSVCAFACVVAVGGLTAAGGPVQAEMGAAATAPAVVPFDFDGDGYADLAVGAQGEDVGSIRDAGIVQVLYGSAAGPTARDQIWQQNTKGIKGRAETGDQFGQVTASGDFDGDGYADLAIGIPVEDLGGEPNVGAVQVLYGSARGLTARDQLWHQGKAGVPGANEAGDLFGMTLGAGDFDGDGRADLSIGVRERFADSSSLGRFVVLRGSSSGLTAAGVQSWNPASLYTTRSDEWTSQVVGDFNDDGRDDLALVPYDMESNAMLVLPGSPTGLTSTGIQVLPGSEVGLREPFGGYGLRGTSGDFNADGLDDLAMVSGDPDRRGARTLVVLTATPDGFMAATAQLWHLHGGVPVLADPNESFVPQQHCSEFGLFGIAAGDLSGDGAADLVVSSQRSDGASAWDTCPQTGDEVYLLLGSAGGLKATDLTLAGDREGAQLHVLGSRGPAAWLSVGRASDVGSVFAAGEVTVVPGAAQGVAPAQGQEWNQNSPGIKGAAEAKDLWGG